MPRTSLWAGAGLGAAAGVALLAVSWLADAVAGLPFWPYDLFEAFAGALPGSVITFGIALMVDAVTALGLGPTSAAAKAAEQALALGAVLVATVIAGLVLAAVGRVAGRQLVLAGLLAGAVALAVAAAAVSTRTGLSAAGLVWLALLLPGAGALLGWAIRRSSFAPEAVPGRRRFLAAFAGGAVVLAAVALGLSRWLGRGRGRPGTTTAEAIGAEGTSGPAASPPAQALAARIEPVAGTRAELTPNAEFYRIDINLRPPEIDGDEWRLRADGLVERPAALSLAELRARPAVSQVVTLECISNRVGGDLISTTRFTGVRLKELLGELGVRREARAIHVTAADGFHESVSLEDARDERTLLAYEMNGVPLPVEHGFPLRISIPNRYGMKQPKWIRRLEIVDRVRPGYWVERGWSEQAIVKTTAVVDVVGTGMMVGAQPTLPIGGIAYAGARGVSRVEVQVDDGPWAAATLRAPPLGPLTWVQWRYDWPYRPGRHTFRVRAYDGTGALQPTEERGPRPDGAAGIHSMTVTV